MRNPAGMPVFYLFLFAAPFSVAANGQTHENKVLQRQVDLAGTWRFAADRNDAGVAERWFATTLSGSIRLPGSMAENGLGDAPGVETKWTGGIVDKSWFTAPEYAPYREPGNVKVPFWLNPVKVYVGPAW
jgi:hypothetical protein